MSKKYFQLCITGEIGVEVWKEISGSNHFEVSTDGRIRQFDSIKTPWTSDNDYDIVTIRINGKPKHLRVHKLVGEAFLPKWSSEHNQINHKDENKHNNKVGNLEWCDASYNCNYGNGKQSRYNDGQPIKVAQYTPNGEYVKTYNSIEEAYKSIGCSYIQMKNHLEKKKSCLSVKGFKFEYA